ncbi:MAG: ABC transporter permease [Chloroflexi bacterium]|nr:ABC transporter permease [Chloroflexota bacterium]
MSGRRILALAGRIILQFRRDRRTLALMVVVPILVLTLLAALFRMESPDIKLAVVNEDRAPESAVLGSPALASRIIAALEATGDFAVTEIRNSQVDSYLAQGKADAVLIFPENYTRRDLLGRREKVDLILEGSNPGDNAKIVQKLSTAFPHALLSFTRPVGGDLNLENNGTFDLLVQYYYGGDQFDDLDYFAPAFIPFFVFFFIFILTSVSFLRERSQGTLERILASPLSRAEIFLGYMLGFSFFAGLQSLIIVLFTTGVLQIHYNGNIGVIFLITLLLTIGAVNLGIFLSTFARNELQVVQFIPLVTVPQGLLSGLIWAVKDMPEALQLLAGLLPMTYANEALREVMIKGLGLDAPLVARDIMVLLVFAALMVALGVATLRRQAS